MAVASTDCAGRNGRPITKSDFWFKTIDSGPVFNVAIGPHGYRIPSAYKSTERHLLLATSAVRSSAPVKSVPELTSAMHRVDASIAAVLQLTNRRTIPGSRPC